MRHVYRAALLAAALVTMLAVVGGAAGKTDKRATQLYAGLTGLEEVPPVDGPGMGKVQFDLDIENAKICWHYGVFFNEDVITAAYIHKGGRGTNGPKVLNSSPVPPDADDGEWQGCASVRRMVIAKLETHPRAYYVNVYDKAHPRGVLRGQLSRADAG
jgi:hypothetical protein